MKYRSRVVEIEAVQFNKIGDHPAVAPNPGNVVHGAHFTVFGWQGWSRVNIGDWIITESDPTKGFYPCEPSAFARKYEAIE